MGERERVRPCTRVRQSRPQSLGEINSAINMLSPKNKGRINHGTGRKYGEHVIWRNSNLSVSMMYPTNINLALQRRKLVPNFKSSSRPSHSTPHNSENLLRYIHPTPLTSTRNNFSLIPTMYTPRTNRQRLADMR